MIVFAVAAGTGLGIAIVASVVWLMELWKIRRRGGRLDRLLRPLSDWLDRLLIPARRDRETNSGL